MINFNYPLIGGKLIERKIRQWREEGIEAGIVEGRAKGRAEERAEWVAWNNRRLEAQRNGEPFDEPPPDAPRKTAAFRGAFTVCNRRRGTPPASPARRR